MILNKETAQKTAELLLQINAIKLQPQNPFTWASGWKSPIYCDNRITMSYPVIRNYLKESLANQIEELYGRPDIIAGVATGAIGIGAIVAAASLIREAAPASGITDAGSSVSGCSLDKPQT